jgi:hypothetical protein
MPINYQQLQRKDFRLSVLKCREALALRFTKSSRSTLQIFKRAASQAEAMIGFGDSYDRRRLLLFVREFFRPKN